MIFAKLQVFFLWIKVKFDIFCFAQVGKISLQLLRKNFALRKNFFATFI